MENLPFTYMPKPDVLKAVGFGDSTLAAKVKAGEFPAPDRIGTRSLWRSTAIAQWLTDQAALADKERSERDQKAKAKAKRLAKAREEARAA